jgi:flavodoxin
MRDRTEKVDVIYFSWTGNTKKVADVISHELSTYAKVKVTEITPKRDYPYLFWLFLSFLPNIGVAIEGGESIADTVFICMPKWTVNCPPIATLMRKTDLKEKTVFLVITYGGFDEKRYAESYKRKIGKLCREVKDVLLVKRSRILSGDDHAIKQWVATVKDSIKGLEHLPQ